ncbi:MAG: anhydro-N-acetylmuramic acid kinase [Ignavibacteria bacterium]|nr:anhydro-N-acetylmuramic acid kinase [Ignavibacteria bacterium]MCU7517893.1 anhydro-N-acetylmuramic acid kinase [Ignavibacteria bacterium]
MQNLIQLNNKGKKYVIGLMSGTSLDGVDAVLLEITGNGTSTKLRQIDFLAYPFPEGLKDLVLKNSARETSNVEDICRLNFLIPMIYADAIKALCNKNSFPLENLDLIGSHGQTIHHLPDKHNMFGYEVRSTLQIADPAVIAKLTGVVTVGDFRTGDIALDGQGAPLVPFFDYLLLYSDEHNRALLNVGGISNFTILKKGAKPAEIRAFDTGPGNMMIDILARRFMGKEYDEDGKTALRGKVNEKLLAALKAKDTYIEKAPPKSTGRELYGEAYLKELLEKYVDVSTEDWMSTVTNFTAYAIFRNYEKFIREKIEIDELIISGGGARNLALIKFLKDYFGDSVSVMNIEELGISSDAKEAICFAVLANETVSGNTSNLPSVTGAKKETILGKICLP